MRIRKRNWLLTMLMFAVAGSANAQTQRSEAEDRLRDMLRQTTIELRDAQSQNVELRAKLDGLNAQLTASAGTARPNVDSAALRRAQTEAMQLRAALDEARLAIEERDQELAQWKQAYGQAEQLSHTRDSEAKRLDELQKTLAQRVEGCERDNAQLVELAEEVLESYQKKGVWAAIRDAEPVTGIQRVQLETLAQKYRARIMDLQARPSATPDSQQ